MAKEYPLSKEDYLLLDWDVRQCKGLHHNLWRRKDGLIRELEDSMLADSINIIDVSCAQKKHVDCMLEIHTLQGRELLVPVELKSEQEKSQDNCTFELASNVKYQEMADYLGITDCSFDKTNHAAYDKLYRLKLDWPEKHHGLLTASLNDQHITSYWRSDLGLFTFQTAKFASAIWNNYMRFSNPTVWLTHGKSTDETGISSLLLVLPPADFTRVVRPYLITEQLSIQAEQDAAYQELKKLAAAEKKRRKDEVDKVLGE